MLLALLIGIFAGLRAVTPLAATAWALHLGWLHADGMLSHLGSSVAVAITTLLALGELAGDKLPTTPSRTAPPGLIARLVTGAIAGGAVAGGMGAAAGAVGAIAGTFGGYQARTGLVRALGTPDLPIALLEDAIAVAGSLWVVSRG
jgi:uncharacterized membrane protein